MDRPGQFKFRVNESGATDVLHQFPYAAFGEENNMITLFILTLCAVILYVMLRGAPYLPTKREGIEAMLELAEISPGLRVVDLGSGDGRLVIAFAKRGAIAHGFELNPLLVWLSRWRLRRYGVADRGKIVLADIWRADLSLYEVVVVFGVTSMMPRLEKKLRRELTPGSRVLSYIFTFPSWHHRIEKNGVRLYVA